MIVTEVVRKMTNCLMCSEISLQLVATSSPLLRNPNDGIILSLTPAQ